MTDQSFSVSPEGPVLQINRRSMNLRKTLQNYGFPSQQCDSNTPAKIETKADPMGGLEPKMTSSFVPSNEIESANKVGPFSANNPHKSMSKLKMTALDQEAKPLNPAEANATIPDVKKALSSISSLTARSKQSTMNCPIYR